MNACRFHLCSHRKARGAFSLLELLIVIAIIAVVAALAFPALQNFSDRAKVVKCVGNLRQMATVLGTYAADNRGEWPYPADNRVNVTPLGTWLSRPMKDSESGLWLGSGKLFPYLNDKRVYVCPANANNVRTLKNIGDYTSTEPPYLNDYVTRGFNQSYNPTNPQFRILATMDRRAIISCTFAYAASNPTAYPLSWHKGVYPVLYSDGSVLTCRFPSGAIKSSVPPDINSNTNMQIRIWDYFDGKTTTLSL